MKAPNMGITYVKNCHRIGKVLGNDNSEVLDWTRVKNLEKITNVEVGVTMALGATSLLLTIAQSAYHLISGNDLFDSPYSMAVPLFPGAIIGFQSLKHLFEIATRENKLTEATKETIYVLRNRKSLSRCEEKVCTDLEEFYRQRRQEVIGDW